MKKLLAIALVASLTSGCAMLDNPAVRSGASAGLEAGKYAAPQYAAQISQLQRVLKGAQADVDAIDLARSQGFEYERIWTVDGETKPASSIAFTDVLKRPSRPGAQAPGVVADTQTDAVYRKTLADAQAIVDALLAGEEAGDE
jgi:hypothetical protein